MESNTIRITYPEAAWRRSCNRNKKLTKTKITSLIDPDLNLISETIKAREIDTTKTEAETVSKRNEAMIPVREGTILMVRVDGEKEIKRQTASQITEKKELTGQTHARNKSTYLTKISHLRAMRL